MAWVRWARVRESRSWEEPWPLSHCPTRGTAGLTATPWGVHRDRLKLSVPYGIAIDLTAVDEL